ncbi:MAG: methionine--tRNA ligase [Myxococcales bacterium]|nr:methionine--tRNA ligase [Myxococcales bacterium]
MSHTTFYVTTPIYYVNGDPHIGHAYTTTAADAITRFHRLAGRSAWFLTGTDEHGQKVLEAARARGLEPQAHCDAMVERWKAMMAELGIGYDRFMRTTDPDHVAVVQGALSRLHAAGELYRDTYTGWYSTAAERFWTEKDLVDGKCPDTGQPVVEITETNWFFRMSAYRDRLIAHIEEHPGFIRPASRRNEILGFLRKELGDLCISRPKERMSWGIELPFDPDFVTYVWFDALLNYLTGAGYRADGNFDDSGRWPADFQLLGKDILTTHAVYWSTMLMALGVELPRALFAHGWWTADGVKMSKSLGNTIDTLLLKEAFGLDATRYFLLREIAFGADGSFSYEAFLARYNSDLANDFGNLAHRGLSMTAKWLGGEVPPIGELTDLEQRLRRDATVAVREVDLHLGELAFQKALEAVNALVRAGNKYIDDTQPWALAKAGDDARLATVMRHVLEVCNVAAALLAFVMPERCATLLERLGQDDVGAAFRDVRERARIDELPLDALREGTPIEVGEPLFPRFREMPGVIAERLEPPAPPRPASDPTISWEDFAKVALRAGTVVSAEPHPAADRLLVLRVDIGEPRARQIVAGIADRFRPEALVGKQVVVVANLAPADLRGVRSEGMLLAAGGKAVVDLVTVDAEPGEIIR